MISLKIYALNDFPFTQVLIKDKKIIYHNFILYKGSFFIPTIGIVSNNLIIKLKGLKKFPKDKKRI